MATKLLFWHVSLSEALNSQLCCAFCNIGTLGSCSYFSPKVDKTVHIYRKHDNHSRLMPAVQMHLYHILPPLCLVLSFAVANAVLWAPLTATVAGEAAHCLIGTTRHIVSRAVDQVVVR